MNLVQMYELDYTGKDIPQHVMYQIAGIENDRMKANSAESIEVAEFFLNMIEFNGKNVIREMGKSGASAEVTQNVAKYVKHTHAACRDEIESRFQKPMLSEDEVSDILFGEILEQELDKISEGLKVSNSDLQQAVASVNSTLKFMAQIQEGKNSQKIAAKGLTDRLGERFGIGIADALRRSWR